MLPAIALIGLGLGVVINLLADSLPIRRRVTGPGCQSCGGPRPFSAWSALVGTVAGGNRCRYCGTGRGVRSVAIEVGAILGATALYLRDPAAWPLATGVVAGFIFLLIGIIDLEHRLILHMVSLPSALILGVMRSLDPGQGLAKTLAGGAAGFGILLAMYLLGIVFSRVAAARRARPLDEVAFGFGDVMLGGVLGLALGWPGVIVGIVLGVFAAGLFSLGLLVFHLARRTYESHLAIPYGPFLLLGAGFVLYGGRAAFQALAAG
jgi:prepilin signal peptidase PulO-like enzyme (type II secretory pathway)